MALLNLNVLNGPLLACLSQNQIRHPDFALISAKINSVTEPDVFPLPRTDDCIDQVGSARFVSKFDLLEGYWQVPLTEWAQKSFVTPVGLYSY